MLILARALFMRENFYSFVMICYATMLNLTWGVLGWLDPSSFGATPLYAMHRLVGGHDLAPALYVVAACLTISSFLFKSPLARLLMLLPMQATFVVAATGSVLAIVAGHFADGNYRSRFLIASDQAPIILSALGYSVDVVFAALAAKRPTGIKRMIEMGEDEKKGTA